MDLRTKLKSNWKKPLAALIVVGLVFGSGYACGRRNAPEVKETVTTAKTTEEAKKSTETDTQRDTNSKATVEDKSKTTRVKQTVTTKKPTGELVRTTTEWDTKEFDLKLNFEYNEKLAQLQRELEETRRTHETEIRVIESSRRNWLVTVDAEWSDWKWAPTVYEAAVYRRLFSSRVWAGAGLNTELELKVGVAGEF